MSGRRIMALNQKVGTVFDLLSLRHPLALMLLLMILCGGQGAPNPNSAQAGPEANPELPPERIKSGQGPVSVQSLRKSRVKRGGLELKPPKFSMASLVVVFSSTGIKSERLVPIDSNTATEKVKDGRNCWTGQEPWNKEEAAGFKTFVAGLLGAQFNVVYMDLPPEALAELAPNCQSGKCYLDGQTWTFTCGVPDGKFPDGKTCGIGADPLAEAEATKGDSTGIKAKYDSGEYDRVDAQKQMDQVVAPIGKNCENGKCYFSFDKMSGICSSHSIKPLSILVTSLFGLSVFFILLSTSG